MESVDRPKRYRKRYGENEGERNKDLSDATESEERWGEEGREGGWERRRRRYVPLVLRPALVVCLSGRLWPPGVP